MGELDYQGFASENPEQLARAIEKGIPSNLRGMVWQLMYYWISLSLVLWLIPTQVSFKGPTNGGNVLEVVEGDEPT